MSLVNYFPEDEVFKTVQRYKTWLWMFLFVAFLIIGIYSAYTYKFIHKPLNLLAESFSELETGNLDISIQHNHDDEFRHIYRSFNAMSQRLNNLINQVYRQKILSQKAELKQLQSQINPHFLHNSFFILSRMIKGSEYEGAAEFAKQLGNYFQFVTRSGSEFTAMQKEVEHARIYTDIQEIRFSR